LGFRQVRRVWPGLKGGLGREIYLTKAQGFGKPLVLKEREGKPKASLGLKVEPEDAKKT